MIAGIFMLAAMLVIAAAASLTGGIMLVPTDLGFAYLQAGSILIGAGAIVMAVGFAARVLDRRLASLASSGVVRPAIVESAAEPPEVETVGLKKLPEEPAPSSAVAGAATAAIAAAGATLAATSLLRDRGDEARMPETAPIAADLPESDPFNDILKDATGVIPLSEADASSPVEDLSGPEAASEDVAPVQDEPATPAVDLPPVDLPLPVDLEAIRIAVDEAVEETAAPVEAAKPQGAEEMPAQEPSNDKYVATEPLEELSPAPSPSTPGLIADADLAALSDDIGPHLAPLESLSPVGSYDSGGTRFTMYSDGSVVALGPDGERRFRSLEELRRHIGSA